MFKKEAAPLEPYIIEYIKEKERKKREKEDQDRPRIDIPDSPPDQERIPNPDKKPDRGVVIINPDGTETKV